MTKQEFNNIYQDHRLAWMEAAFKGKIGDRLRQYKTLTPACSLDDKALRIDQEITGKLGKPCDFCPVDIWRGNRMACTKQGSPVHHFVHLESDEKKRKCGTRISKLKWTFLSIYEHI